MRACSSAQKQQRMLIGAGTSEMLRAWSHMAVSWRAAYKLPLFMASGVQNDSLSSLTHDCVPLRCRTHRSTELRGLSRNCQKCPIAIATERGGESAVPAPPPPPARHVCALPRRRFIFAYSLRLLDTAQVPGRERPSQHAAATRAACVSPGGLKPSESLPP